MANLKIKFKITFILYIMLVSCKTSYNFELLEAKWKNDVIYKLSEKYPGYAQNHDLGKNRRSEIDLFYKIEEINRFPVGISFKNLRNQVESKRISFDSIICVNTQSNLGLDQEYLYPNYYYIFRNGKIHDVIIFEPNKFKIVNSENTLSELMTMFLIDAKKIDGNDRSLLIFTKIKPDWKFEVTKLVINCQM